MGIKVIREKIINVILNALIFVFGIILLISIYNNLQVKVFGKDYSDFFGYSIFEVQTGSMKDAINPGDWIIVKSTSSIKLNDVITYKQGKDFITHRVIGAYNDTFITKGDANNSKDEPIDKKQIVGKVVKIKDGSGVSRYNVMNVNWITNALSKIDFDFEKYLPTPTVGTLQKRMRELTDRAYLKTGTLYGVSSLAGVIKTDDKEYYYSSIIMSLNRNKSFIKGVEDEIIYEIYRLGEYDE